MSKAATLPAVTYGVIAGLLEGRRGVVFEVVSSVVWISVPS